MRARVAFAYIFVRNLSMQGSVLLKGKNMLVFGDNQGVQLQVSFTDKKGAPATLASGEVPTWTSSDPTKATVTVGIWNGTQIGPDPTGLNAVVEGVAPGTCQINVVATNADNSQAAGVLDVQITGGEPANAVIGSTTPPFSLS